MHVYRCETSGEFLLSVQCFGCCTRNNVVACVVVALLGRPR